MKDITKSHDDHICECTREAHLRLGHACRRVGNRNNLIATGNADKEKHEWQSARAERSSQQASKGQCHDEATSKDDAHIIFSLAREDTQQRPSHTHTYEYR